MKQINFLWVRIVTDWWRYVCLRHTCLVVMRNDTYVFAVCYRRKSNFADFVRQNRRNCEVKSARLVGKIADFSHLMPRLLRASEYLLAFRRCSS